MKKLKYNKYTHEIDIIEIPEYKNDVQKIQSKLKEYKIFIEVINMILLAIISITANYLIIMQINIEKANQDIGTLPIFTLTKVGSDSDTPTIMDNYLYNYLRYDGIDSQIDLFKDFDENIFSNLELYRLINIEFEPFTNNQLNLINTTTVGHYDDYCYDDYCYDAIHDRMIDIFEDPDLERVRYIINERFIKSLFSRKEWYFVENNGPQIKNLEIHPILILTVNIDDKYCSYKIRRFFRPANKLENGIYFSSLSEYWLDDAQECLEDDISFEEDYYAIFTSIIIIEYNDILDRHHTEYYEIFGDDLQKVDSNSVYVCDEYNVSIDDLETFSFTNLFDKKITTNIENKYNSGIIY